MLKKSINAIKIQEGCYGRIIKAEIKESRVMLYVIYLFVLWFCHTLLIKLMIKL